VQNLELKRDKGKAQDNLSRSHPIKAHP
jgi:hypothetical protein